jgi:hypothetical protein
MHFSYLDDVGSNLYPGTLIAVVSQLDEKSVVGTRNIPGEQLVQLVFKEEHARQLAGQGSNEV